MTTTHAISKYPALCQCGCGRISAHPHELREIQSRGETDVSVPTVYAPECCTECRKGKHAN